jgi:hypothetical protein
VLTIAITGECAIVVDATSSARQWYEMMKDVIGHEVSLASSTSFMVIPWTDLTPKAFPAKPEKIGRDRLSELDAALTQSPVNSASPVAFVELALAERCDQIIFITGTLLDETVVNSLREAINKRVDTQLDVIIIGDQDERLQKLAAENKGPAKKGRYVSVTTEQLRKWYEEWKK